MYDSDFYKTSTTAWKSVAVILSICSNTTWTFFSYFLYNWIIFLRDYSIKFSYIRYHRKDDRKWLKMRCYWTLCHFGVEVKQSKYLRKVYLKMILLEGTRFWAPSAAAPSASVQIINNVNTEHANQNGTWHIISSLSLPFSRAQNQLEKN